MQKLKEDENYFRPVLAVRLKQFMVEKMNSQKSVVFRFAGEPLRALHDSFGVMRSSPGPLNEDILHVDQ